MIGFLCKLPYSCLELSEGETSLLSVPPDLINILINGLVTNIVVASSPERPDKENYHINDGSKSFHKFE